MKSLGIVLAAVFLYSQSTPCAAPTSTSINPNQIRGLAQSATVDATNAANISAGTLPNSRLLGIPNSALANSFVTINPGAGLSSTASTVPLGGATTLSTSIRINAQTGTSYTVINSDQGKLLTFKNSSGSVVTVPPAGLSSQFLANWFADFQNIGSGTVVIKPDTSTINGSSSLSLAYGQGVRLVSDGANYQIFALPVTNLGTTGPGGVTGVLPVANVSGLAPSATTDTTNAANIASGTINAGRLPSLISSSTSGNAATATSLSTTPVTCPPNQAATGVDSKGNALGCFTPVGGSGLQAPTTGNVLVKYTSGSSTTAAIPGTDYQTPTYTPNGAAVARSIQSKLQETVSVTDFGADPTGVGDSTSAFNNALSSACPSTVRIPTGKYLITGQLTVSCVGTSLIGDGSRTTFLNFNPSSTATALLLQNSNSSIQLAQNTIRGFTLYGEGNAVKTGIDMVDAEEVLLRDIACRGNVNSSWSDPTHSSICLLTQGRQNLWVENFVANADLPIEIAHNPRSGSSVQIDIDHATFRNLYLLSYSANSCVTIADNVVLTQVTFDGSQSFVFCKRAFSWVATSNSTNSTGLTITGNPRWEQSTSSDYFAYISMPSSGSLYDFRIENWREGSSNGGANGFYFRNVHQVSIEDGIYQDPHTFINADSSVYGLMVKNVWTNSSSSITDTSTGSVYLNVNGIPLESVAYKASTGKNYACFDTSGKLVSSSSPCN